MTESRALRMAPSEAASLGRIRLHSGVEVAVEQDAIWIRAKVVTEDLESELRLLPGTRFNLLPDGQLAPFGAQVPNASLPDADWVELAQWLQIRTEPAAFAGVLRDRVAVRLVRGGEAGESNVMVTPLACWHAYAINAAQVRLDQLAFAVSDDHLATVWGTPLPPIQGVRFVERMGVAAAAGWTWHPPVDRAVLAEMVDVAKHDLALFHADGTWELIRGDEFVRATRSAVRRSLEATHA